MRKNYLLFCLPLMGLAVLTQTGLGQINPQADRYVVELRPGVEPAEVLAAHGLAARHIYRHAISGFAAQIPPGRLQLLANDPRVATVAADLQVFAFAKPVKPPPSDPQPPKSYPLLRGTGGGILPAGVDRIGALRVNETGKNIGVAVVDSGLDFNHPDLSISDSSFCSPGVGDLAQDDAGHGTHVGGIIAALENSTGVVGVAPDATLYAVKVLDSQGSGYDSDIIGGLNWLAANADSVAPKIRVVNMSLGRTSSPFDSPMRSAIQTLVNAGISVVAAAGNDPSTEVSRMVPAGFPEVIAVASTTARAGATDQNLVIAADTASFFTTDGKFNTRTGVGVAISAPGATQEDIAGGYIYSQGIESTALGGTTTLMSGTSMAAPHVAGVIALLLEKEPLLGAAEIKARIMGGDAEGVAPLNSPTFSYTYDREREGILFAPIVLGY